MRRRRTTEALPPELELATGLVWGHLNAYQYENAYDLAAGCLALWPGNVHLQLMHDYAAAELLEPVDQARLRSLRTADNAAWVDLILLRLQAGQRSAVAA